jgi:hypothetical protein
MRMRTVAPIAAALISLMVGCGHDDRDATLDGQEHPRKIDGSPVAVFLTSKPDRPYTDIALLRFKSERTGEKQLIKLRALTREKGGDAVYVIGKGSATDRNFFGEDTSRDITEAIVVVWK